MTLRESRLLSTTQVLQCRSKLTRAVSLLFFGA